MDQPAVSLAYPKPESGVVRIALWRFDRLLERFFPDRLFARALIIVIAPIVLLQLIMGYVFIERHYEEVTRSLSRSYVREVAMLIDLYRESDRSPLALEQVRRIANDQLLLGLEVRRGEALPKPAPKPWLSSVIPKLNRYVSRRVNLPFWIDTEREPGFVDLRIEVEPGMVFRFLSPIERAHAPSRHVFLLWMALSSLVLLLIAILFLRHQINPILRLAEAAHAFGLGREVKDFRPAGAREVQEAANAFLAMKGRIERNVEQRTAMLAGVSHDLRTILTRLTLELAMSPTSPPVEAMREDLAEMRRMLEGYLAFARGDGGEEAEPVDVGELLESVRSGLARTGKPIEIRSPPGWWRWRSRRRSSAASRTSPPTPAGSARVSSSRRGTRAGRPCSPWTTTARASRPTATRKCFVRSYGSTMRAIRTRREPGLACRSPATSLAATAATFACRRARSAGSAPRSAFRSRDSGQNSRPPFGTGRSIAASTTSPSASGKPSVSTSDMNLPIWRGLKLTTAATWRPRRPSGV